jgi:hypothetical protein
MEQSSILARIEDHQGHGRCASPREIHDLLRGLYNRRTGGEFRFDNEPWHSLKREYVGQLVIVTCEANEAQRIEVPVQDVVPHTEPALKAILQCTSPFKFLNMDEMYEKIGRGTRRQKCGPRDYGPSLDDGWSGQWLSQASLRSGGVLCWPTPHEHSRPLEPPVIIGPQTER